MEMPESSAGQVPGDNMASDGKTSSGSKVGRVAHSRQVCIYVVKVLLIAIYLSEEKDVYIHI
jgi:hypothetical protein